MPYSWSLIKRTVLHGLSAESAKPDPPPPYSSTTLITTNLAPASQPIGKKITLRLKLSNGEQDQIATSYINISPHTTFALLQSKIKQRILETNLMRGDEAFHWDVWDDSTDLLLVVNLESWPGVRDAMLESRSPEVVIGISQGWWAYRAPNSQQEVENFVRSHEYNESRLLLLGRYVPPPRMTLE